MKNVLHTFCSSLVVMLNTFIEKICYYFYLNTDDAMRRKGKKNKLKVKPNKDQKQINKIENQTSGLLEGASVIGQASKTAPLAVIYRSEMDYISRCIGDYPNIETGGQLFGFLQEDGVAVVCYAIGPGKSANHQVTFFNQDTEYLQTVYNEISRKYGLRYIGEWHSHHQLGLAKPSGHDALTVIHGIQRHNFQNFLLCIGNCDRSARSTLNAFSFNINSITQYKHVPWRIIEIESPYRNLIDNSLRGLICHPRTTKASYGPNYILSAMGNASMVTPNYDEEYWLNNKNNNQVLKNIIDFLKNQGGATSQVKPFLDEEKKVHLVVISGNDNIEIYFGNKFPLSAPIFKKSNGDVIEPHVKWECGDNIYESFVTYYKMLNINVI
ncbi:MAG: hypothetical protein KBT32_05135 [Bacteroidales bacterium]|nr:hypothetical protein [Candidatus Physcocola equi]